MKKFFIILTATALAAGTTFGQNLLSNPGFEDGDLVTWTVVDNGGTIAPSTDYANSGLQSLSIDSTGAGAWSSPQVTQTFAAAPGDVFNFSGSILTPVTIGDGSFGVFKIVFRDGAGGTGNDLVPANVDIGVLNEAFPGAESDVFVNSGSATEQWFFSEAQATAPAGTQSVIFFVLNVNQGSAPSAIFYDDVSATVVPEPGTYAAILGLLALAVVAYRRRK